MKVSLEGLKIVDYFQRGTPVKTQIKNSINWIPNVVFDTYSNKNEVGIIFDDRYEEFVIFPEDLVKLKYPVGKMQYNMGTVVTSVRQEAVKIMTLKIKSIEQIPNLRRCERYSINYAANIVGFRDMERNFVSITNISLLGLAFISKQTYFVEDNINISILLPLSNFEITGTIVRYNNTIKGMEYGVEFIYEDDKVKEEWGHVIEDIKKREDSLSCIMGIDF